MNTVLKHKVLVLYIGLNIFAALLMVLHKSNFSFNIRTIYSLSIYPLQNATKNISQAFVKLYTGITDVFILRDQIIILRDRISDLEGTALEYDELYRENIRLRQTLNEKPQGEYPLEYAEIISKDPQNFYITIIINKGSAHGISVGMPVIAYQNGVKGLVGKIIETRLYNSRVLSIVDQRSKISVMLEASRTTGIMTGQSPKSAQTYLEYIDRDVDVDEGERVVTSGMGGVFPKGILVGNIFKIEKKSYGLFHDIYVEPIVLFSSLEDVYIVKKIPDEEVIELLSEEDELIETLLEESVAN